MTRNQHQPAAALKASFANIYNNQDPRAYLTTLVPLEYTIPQQVLPFFQRLHQLCSEGKDASAILDVCCSYGINGALLRHHLDIQTWTSHYKNLELSSEQQILADREFFAIRAKPIKPVVFGLDKAANAIRYALETGLMDCGWAEDLEIHGPSPGLSKALKDVSLIICTGGASYVGSRTFGRVMAAVDTNQVWVVSTVIRMVPYDDIETKLREHGLVTEKLPGVVLLQRRFASIQEQHDVVSKVEARGFDSTGLESRGYLCAEIFLSRPAAQISTPPIADLTEVFSRSPNVATDGVA
ncbi:methyltransferase type 12 [Fusarium heterosporum]|uniref:Methyltransferase type 12 n=1 Tax=Fusarium heterosporum TaxID=42747 RepID=A0A8H5T069_FUSHE|nr:methyltransferase type 12 [Fusarium heterosporum]